MIKGTSLHSLPYFLKLTRWSTGISPDAFHIAGYRHLIGAFVELDLGQRMPWGRGLPAGSNASHRHTRMRSREAMEPMAQPSPALPSRKATNSTVLGVPPAPDAPRRQCTAQSLVETAVGCLLLVVLALAGLDLISLVLAQMANDTFAKQAARAAAEKDTEAKARSAADSVKGQFQASSMLTNIRIEEFSYDDTRVRVKTKLDLSLPVPLPLGLGDKTVTMQSAATEAVIAKPAT